jgi:hypothetical protein
VESPSGFGPNVDSAAEAVCADASRMDGSRVIAATVAASRAKDRRLSESILFEDFCVSIALHQRSSLTLEEIGRIAEFASYQILDCF